MNSLKPLRLFALAAAAFVLVGSSCNRDKCDPGEDCSTHDSEVITKVALVFSDSATGALAFEGVFDDPDGPGGAGPTEFDTLRFSANTTYNADIKVYGQHDGHTEEITSEIQAENDEHIFCFTPSGVSVTVTRTDSDGNFPTGLTSKWRAGAAGGGTVKVELRHQPDGQKDGTCTPGETDVQVVFPTVVQ